MQKLSFLFLVFINLFLDAANKKYCQCKSKQSIMITNNKTYITLVSQPIQKLIIMIIC